jgi:hypothetical protein
MKEYSESLYSNKLEELEEIYKFLPKLSQKDISDLKRPITSDEIEVVIKEH